MRPATIAFDETPSPPPGSPPPPFDDELRRSQSFREVDWKGTGKDDDDAFDLRKGPLVGPLASGLDKMREAGKLDRDPNLPRSDSGTSFQGYHEDYPVKKGGMDYYADDYEHVRPQLRRD